MALNATYNNISVISWQSCLLVEETRAPGENHWPVPSHWQTLSHTVMLYRVHLSWAWFELTTLVVIGTDCIGSCKSNYHTIMTKTTPIYGQSQNDLNIKVVLSKVLSLISFSSFCQIYYCAHSPQLSFWEFVYTSL